MELTTLLYIQGVFLWLEHFKLKIHPKLWSDFYHMLRNYLIGYVLLCECHWVRWFCVFLSEKRIYGTYQNALIFLICIGNELLKDTHLYILLHCDRTNQDKNTNEPITETTIIGLLQNRKTFKKLIFFTEHVRQMWENFIKISLFSILQGL